VSFLFGKRETAQAYAEVIENGREKAQQKMKSFMYKDYRGSEPIFKIMVRVEPPNDYPFEAQMKTGLSHAFLLLPGVRVQIKYNPGRQSEVTFNDDDQEILKRNPQLIRKV
jgi:hypothetical protein